MHDDELEPIDLGIEKLRQAVAAVADDNEAADVAALIRAQTRSLQDRAARERRSLVTFTGPGESPYQTPAHYAVPFTDRALCGYDPAPRGEVTVLMASVDTKPPAQDVACEACINIRFAEAVSPPRPRF